MVRAPGAPRLLHAGDGQQGVAPVVAEVALVHERERGETRLLREAAARVGVHVEHELPRPGEEIGVRAFVEQCGHLELVLRHVSGTVDADRAPGDRGAGDVEVGGEVEPVAQAGGAQGVEAVLRLRIDRERGRVALRENRALVVVDAHGVEAHARQVGGEAVRGFDRRRVRAVDEVDAAEADFLAGAAFELEVVADGDDASEGTGRLVAGKRRGKVEGGAGLDPVLARRGGRVGDPVRPRLQHDRSGFVERDPVARKAEHRVHRTFHAGLDGTLREEQAERDDGGAPRPVVLNEDPLPFREGDLHPRDAVRAEGGEARDLAPEEVRLRGDGFRNRERLVVDEEAARHAADGDPRLKHRLGKSAVAVGRHDPFRVQRAVGRGAERRAPVQAQRPGRDVVPGVAGHVDREGAGAGGVAVEARAAGGAAELPRRRVGAEAEQEVDGRREGNRRTPDGGRGQRGGGLRGGGLRNAEASQNGAEDEQCREK